MLWAFGRRLESDVFIVGGQNDGLLASGPRLPHAASHSRKSLAKGSSSKPLQRSEAREDKGGLGEAWKNEWKLARNGGMGSFARLEVGSRVLECTRKPTARARQAGDSKSGGGENGTSGSSARALLHCSRAPLLSVVLRPPRRAQRPNQAPTQRGQSRR